MQKVRIRDLEDGDFREIILLLQTSRIGHCSQKQPLLKKMKTISRPTVCRATRHHISESVLLSTRICPHISPFDSIHIRLQPLAIIHHISCFCYYVFRNDTQSVATHRHRHNSVLMSLIMGITFSTLFHRYVISERASESASEEFEGVIFSKVMARE